MNDTEVIALQAPIEYTMNDNAEIQNGRWAMIGIISALGADYTGSDYQSRATDLHIGYENNIGDLAYYVQGGKTINAADGVDSESNFSGKLGASVSPTDKLGFYGEVSFAQVEDADNTYGTKLGAKYSF